MPNCVVMGCKNYNQRTKSTSIKYFRFPKNKDLKTQWVMACQRKNNINLKNDFTCKPEPEETFLRCKSEPESEEEDILMSSAGTSTCVFETQEVLELKSLKQQEIYSNISISEQQLSILQKTENNTERNQTVDLLLKINTLESQNKELVKQIKEAKAACSYKYETALARVFTPGQIKKLLNPIGNLKICWSKKDIAFAISLRKISPRAYRYLRRKNYPLPARSTLKNWTDKFDFNKG